VLAIGGEYGTGMIRVTLAAAPRRLTVLFAVRDAGAATGVVLGLLYLTPIITAVIPDHTLARDGNAIRVS
jgi:ABC-2 type transport system permease protein